MCGGLRSRRKGNVDRSGVIVFIDDVVCGGYGGVTAYCFLEGTTRCTEKEWERRTMWR